jgi:hypothetical protein
MFLCGSKISNRDITQGCADFAEFFFSNQFINEFLQFIAFWLAAG